MAFGKKKVRRPIRVVAQIDSLSPGDGIRVGGVLYHLESFKDFGEDSRIVLRTRPSAKKGFLEE